MTFRRVSLKVWCGQSPSSLSLKGLFHEHLSPIYKIDTKKGKIVSSKLVNAWRLHRVQKLEEREKKESSIQIQ